VPKPSEARTKAGIVIWPFEVMVAVAILALLRAFKSLLYSKDLHSSTVQAGLDFQAIIWSATP
jgi:hypothetical protein